MRSNDVLQLKGTIHKPICLPWQVIPTDYQATFYIWWHVTLDLKRYMKGLRRVLRQQKRRAMKMTKQILVPANFGDFDNFNGQ